MSSDHRIAVIGGGNMAEAIIRGAIRTDTITPDRWIVAEPRPERRAFLESDPGLGVRTVDSAATLGPLGPDDALLLAIKPQMLDDVARDGASLNLDRVVVSILAGADSTRIRDAFAQGGAEGEPRVIRVMPNTPCGIGAGMTAVARGLGSRDGDEQLALDLFSPIGKVIEIDESLMDAFTAAAGSGPAYVFYLAEGMIQAATDLGLSPEQADIAVRQTLLGAATLLSTSDVDASALRRAVTSPGGTTAAATGVFDEADLLGLIGRALTAARDRGRELSGP